MGFFKKTRTGVPNRAPRTTPLLVFSERSLMKIPQNGIRFAKNVLLLTATSLLMRSVSLSFNLYLNEKLGSDGVGLFSLIMSVFSFAVTFATSGISLLATRLVSEALGRKKPAEAKEAMKKCVGYSLFFGITGCVLLLALARPIGVYLLGDSRTVLSLSALAISLPFIALSAAFSGYFSAVRRVSKSAAAQVGEQFLKITFTVMALTYLAPADLETMCLFVVLGSVLSDFFSFLFSLGFFLFDMKKHNRAKATHVPKDLSRKLLAIGLPIAFSSYFRSALVTVEHLLIPKGLLAFGLTQTEALAEYGILEAMALPMVMFPYAFLTPFCNLLVPEVAERRAAERQEDVRAIAGKALSFVAIFGIGTAAILLTLSHEIGRVICDNEKAALYIAMLAPLVPIMYADTTVDSLLKGLDEQLYSMRVNIFDSLLSVALALITVPLWGIRGYILNIVLCELVNFALSASRLMLKIRPAFSPLSGLLLPLAAAILSCALFRTLLPHFPFITGKLGLFSAIFLAAVLYALTLFALRSLFGIRAKTTKALDIS